MRKVLVIAYYWPPAGGPGVQRWLKFVKYLREFGVEPVVYIPENANYPIIDTSLLKEIPEGIKVYSLPIKEPYALAGLLSPKKTKRISAGIIQSQKQSVLEKAMLWVRGNFFIPDARKHWIKPSVQYLSSIIVKEAIETIITTGPPHSLHLIGYQLKQIFTIKWLADFRDPWTSIGYHKKLYLTSYAKARHKELERTVLNSADEIVVTSAITKSEFGTITSKPISVITNGYDNEEDAVFSLDGKFSISHIGSLLTGRNPNHLWTVLAQLVHENDAFRASLEIKLVGVVSKDVLGSIHSHGLAPYTKTIPYVPHQQAIKMQRESQLLLLVEIDSVETQSIVPGKLFEYLAAKRPILAIGPKHWAVGDILTETGAGEVFGYEDNILLKNTLLEWFGRYRSKSLNIASRNIEKYSRRELTRKMAELL